MTGKSSTSDDASDIDPIDRELGRRIRLRRKTLGISQTALGDALGVSFQQVQKYERGVNRVAGSTLVRLAGALDTTIAALFDESADSPLSATLLDQLSISGALELLQAYADFDSPALRGSLLTLARDIVSHVRKT